MPYASFAAQMKDVAAALTTACDAFDPAHKAVQLACSEHGDGSTFKAERVRHLFNLMQAAATALGEAHDLTSQWRDEA